MKTTILGIGVVATCLVAGLSTANSPSATKPVWNQKAAAAYLDKRGEWWMLCADARETEGGVCFGGRRGRVRVRDQEGGRAGVRVGMQDA